MLDVILISVFFKLLVPLGFIVSQFAIAEATPGRVIQVLERLGGRGGYTCGWFVM